MAATIPATRIDFVAHVPSGYDDSGWGTDVIYVTPPTTDRAVHLRVLASHCRACNGIDEFRLLTTQPEQLRLRWHSQVYSHSGEWQDYEWELRE